MKTNWDAAHRACLSHLPTVSRLVVKYSYTHPHWWVRAYVDNYPPVIRLSCFLVAPEKTRRTTTGVNTGTIGEPTRVQALTPTDEELIEIGDFIATLETADFKPRRSKYGEHPWVEYELRVDYDKFEEG